MNNNKIFLVYPTLIKPGLSVTPYVTPDPILAVNSFPTKCALYVTAVFTFSAGSKLTTEIDIQFNGVSVLSESDNALNTMENFMFTHLDSSRMLGARFYIQNVSIEKPGNYEVFFRLYETNGDTLGPLVEEKTCAFVAIERTGAAN